MSPGVVTEGVTPIFYWKNDLFSSSLSLILISLSGVTPWYHPTPFLPIRPPFFHYSLWICPQFFSFRCHPPGGCHPGQSVYPPPPVTPLDFNVTFAFSSFAFYTHFRTTFTLSQFCILHIFTFALWHFVTSLLLSLIHIWRCRRIERCRSRWSPYH